jgi:hypothetical protein
MTDPAHERVRAQVLRGGVSNAEQIDFVGVGYSSGVKNGQKMWVKCGIIRGGWKI